MECQILTFFTMKKFLFKTIAVSMAGLLFVSQAIAGSNFSVSNEEVAAISFEENEIYSSFDEISELVSYVAENDVTYAEVAAENSALVENVSSSAAMALGNSSAGDPPFLSAFLCGAVLNWVGIVIVALTTEMDMNQIWKAVWGCAAETVIISVIYIIYYFVLYGGYYSGW